MDGVDTEPSKDMASTPCNTHVAVAAERSPFPCNNGASNRHRIPTMVDVPKMTPLSGPTYLGAYDSDSEQEEQELVRDFDGWNLISTDALRSEWPNGDRQVSLSHEEHMFGECKNIACPLPPLWQAAYIQAPILTCTILSKFLAAALTLASLDEPASQHAPRLRASAMAQLIDTTLQQPEVDLSWMPEAELMPDFLPAVKANLLSDPTLLKTSPAVKILLSKIIEHEQEVDLSLFQNLSTEQLSDLTLKLSEAIVSLSLSGPNITADLLTRIVSANPSLQKAYILGAWKVPLQPTLELLHKSNLQAIWHSDMFRRALGDFTQEEIRFPSRLMTSFPVIQIFWVCRKLRVGDHVSHVDDKGIPWTRKAAFPLQDAILPPARVVTGLASFLHFLAPLSSWSRVTEMSTVAMVAAKSFAMTGLADLDVMKQVSWQTLFSNPVIPPFPHFFADKVIYSVQLV
jgi:hypothetical protein